jgi:hypothetical protein
MKHRVSDLPAGPLLDAAMALADGMKVLKHQTSHECWAVDRKGFVGYIGGKRLPFYAPSTDLSGVGALITKYQVCIEPRDPGGVFDGKVIDAHHWLARVMYHHSNKMGLTLPEAVCRAVVANRCGVWVELP